MPDLPLCPGLQPGWPALPHSAISSISCAAQLGKAQGLSSDVITVVRRVLSVSRQILGGPFPAIDCPKDQAYH